jgi:hypothetical protein
VFPAIGLSACVAFGNSDACQAFESREGSAMTPFDKRYMYSVMWMTPHSRVKHVSHFRARERELHEMRRHCLPGVQDVERAIDSRIEVCRRTADLFSLAPDAVSHLRNLH